MNIYIDGFNLYYGCVKNTPHKWLDLSALCQRIFPRYNINQIRYFTARVKPTKKDPQKPQRQQTYIRALETIPNLQIHYGHFLSQPRYKVLANPPFPPKDKIVKVIITEEKGSDVNLATYLLVDGYEGKYDIAVVISNDSDLVEPIRIVKVNLGLPVGVVNPILDKKMTSHILKETASFYYRIKRYQISHSQFPKTMHDHKGSFRKPERW